MKRDWLDAISAILKSEKEDLRSLAEAAGADPKFFYVGQDLSKCKFFGEDLSGINLSGTNISASQFDKHSKLDPEFDPRNKEESQEQDASKRSLLFPPEIVDILIAYAAAAHYTSLGWAAKNLIRIAFASTQEDGSFEKWRRTISRSPDLFGIFRISYKRYRYTITIPDASYSHFYDLKYSFGGASAGIVGAIIIGFLCWAGVRPEDGQIIELSGVLQSAKNRERLRII